MRKLLIAIFTLFIIHSASLAQSADHENVKKSIQQMFDGMRAGDSTMVSKVFAKGIKMQTIVNTPEGVQVKTGSAENFLNAVGTPHDQQWDERISSYEIKIDGDMATAWTPYQFYFGGEFSHCGVNSFQFARLNGKWKIIYIVDTRRKTNCE